MSSDRRPNDCHAVPKDFGPESKQLVSRPCGPNATQQGVELCPRRKQQLPRHGESIIETWEKKCFLNVFRICTNIFVDRRFVTKPHYFCSQLSKFLLISAEQRRLHEYNICTGNLSPTDLFAPWPAMRFFSKYTF